MSTPFASAGLALFDTAIGRCGLVWGERGVLGLQLPEKRESDTRARLLRRFPQALEIDPPAAIQQAVRAIAALLSGEANDLSSISLDMNNVPPFHRRVYELTRGIQPGSTKSYGEIASLLGMPGAARAVGQALGKNPFAIIVPCHRVLAADGKLGGFSANGGVTTKLRLLSIEGAHAEGQLALFEGDGLLSYDPAAAVQHLRESDAMLARVIDAVGPFRMRLDKAASLFLALAEAIVYQQLTAKAAGTIFARVRALFPNGHRGLSAEHILRASEEKLLSAGLSRSKMLALKDLARKAVDGAIPTLTQVNAMENEEIIERLTEVRGIGRWTVEMLLIFRLGRPDVLPVDDLGIRKGFAVMIKKRELPTPEQMEKRGERWRPYRSVASWYLWRATELRTK